MSCATFVSFPSEGKKKHTTILLKHTHTHTHKITSSSTLEKKRSSNFGNFPRTLGRGLMTVPKRRSFSAKVQEENLLGPVVNVGRMGVGIATARATQRERIRIRCMMLPKKKKKVIRGRKKASEKEIIQREKIVSPLLTQYHHFFIKPTFFPANTPHDEKKKTNMLLKKCHVPTNSSDQDKKWRPTLMKMSILHSRPSAQKVKTKKKQNYRRWEIARNSKTAHRKVDDFLTSSRSQFFPTPYFSPSPLLFYARIRVFPSYYPDIFFALM